MIHKWTRQKVHSMEVENRQVPAAWAQAVSHNKRCNRRQDEKKEVPGGK